MPRHAARSDANQVAIVDAFRKAGASVTHLHQVAGGCPDLAVGYRGMTYLVEVKDGSKMPSERKLTPAQEEWFANWRGQACVISSVDEALDLLRSGPAEIELRGWVM